MLKGLFGGSASASNHESPIGALGAKGQKWTDPMAWIFGDKWVDLTSRKIPELSNRLGSKVMQPFEKIDKTINPVRRIPAVDNLGNWIGQKPASAVGMVAGTIATGGAAASAFGGGGGAGAAGLGSTAPAGGGLGGGLGGAAGGSSAMPAATSAAPSAATSGGFNWQQLIQQGIQQGGLPGMGQGGGGQQQNPYLLAMQQQQERSYRQRLAEELYRQQQHAEEQKRMNPNSYGGW